MLCQKRTHFLGQELAEMAVDGQCACEEPDRVLSFEAAQVRLMDEVAQKALQPFRQRPGNFTRYGKVLRLGLRFWRPGLCPVFRRRAAGAGRRALVDRHHEKELWRNSPSPLFAFRYAGSRPAGNDPWRTSRPICSSLIRPPPVRLQVRPCSQSLYQASPPTSSAREKRARGRS